jgi:Family of unknown function (DUF5522)
MKAVEQKTCPSCGVGFTCGPESIEERSWRDHLPHVSLVASEDQDRLCPTCLPAVNEKLNEAGSSAGISSPPRVESGVKPLSLLVEGEDYYSEGAAIVFTSNYHLRRGYCCENTCRHCPYR